MFQLKGKLLETVGRLVLLLTGGLTVKNYPSDDMTLSILTLKLL